MAKKRKANRAANSRSRAKPVFTSPFKDLKRLVKEHAALKPEPTPRSPDPAPLAEDHRDDDASVLREAYDGVRPLNDSGRRRMPIEPNITRQIVSEDAEVLARLSDLVSGQGEFDVTETDEYVEGTRAGIDPRLVVQLRRGDHPTQAHIDLHGMVQEAARTALGAFILQSVRDGLRCVLIVHGRGLGSPGGRPVIKQAAIRWLSRGLLSGHVLAFTTARPMDGGAGAMYVLLRRERRRAPFDVLHGAKRRD